jgi:Mn-dependent DtxR family transcriptional regulator
MASSEDQSTNDTTGAAEVIDSQAERFNHHLAPEILMRIFSYLPFPDFVQYRRVNHNWWM